ncbi:hypothetical protein AB6A40_003746 [Gnathostoma spinigerum]|uniref:Uncharacterized protein n=1 Tax=Gnathostoma spinigerum TaxID=75299 RepID=A0ABD6ECP0_9BILA
MNKKPTRVVRLLNIGFRSLGPIVADYPTTVIITMLVLSAVCSIKLILSPTEDDFREGYTPLDAPAKKEQQVFREFNNGDLIASILMVTAKDGKSMTRLQHLNETIRLMETIGSYTAVRNSTFYDLCTSHCDDNMAVLQFRV